MKFIDLTNKEFNSWTVIKLDTDNKKKNTHWLCKCVCGNIKSIDASHLSLGHSKSCRKCSETKHKNNLNPRIWGRIRYRSKKDKIIFDLDKQYLYDLFYKIQKELCAISNEKLIISNTVQGDMHGETTASLDRIDSNKGYIYNNVWWIHKDINIMKNDHNLQDFITICCNIAKNKENIPNNLHLVCKHK